VHRINTLAVLTNKKLIMVRFLQFFMLLTIMSCVQKKESTKAFQTVDWSEHKAVLNERDSLWKGSSYLSVYSEIYSYSEARTYDLTVTVSLKNIYKNDTVYIERADYYNTKGEKIRNYFDQPIYLKPMETLEIVIDQKDTQGGSGGNFVFDWMVKNPKLEPHFEAVMISTYGQQGLSFTSQGIRVE
jgi:hypothetical protein